MSTVAHLSLTEYEAIVEAGVFSRQGRRRLEFIRGEIREMSPIGDEHEEVLMRLAEWSFANLGGKDARVRVQCAIRLPQCESAPEPDLAWVVRRDYSRRKPEPADILLAVEVAESSLEQDLGEKAELYAAAGISEYWVVDLRSRRIVVHTDPREDQYRNVRSAAAKEELRPLAFPDVAMRAAMLWESR
jgi:Uma2 family endonuclease